MPGLWKLGGSMYSSGSNFEYIFKIAGGISNYILIVFPILALSLYIFSQASKNERLLNILETICYIFAFGVFIFTILSISSVGSYELSFGYTGTVFVYSLIFAVKILDYLITVSPGEEKIWGFTFTEEKSKTKKNSKKKFKRI